MHDSSVFPERRKKSDDVSFRHNVDNWEDERKASVRDSDMRRCAFCRMPNPTSRSTCRACGVENWYLQYDNDGNLK